MKQKSINNAQAVEMFPGITRRTLTYNDQAMLCHFEVKKGATIPLHNHPPVQIGMVTAGKMRFFGETDADEWHTKVTRRLEVTDADEFIAAAGDGYVLESNKPHGGEALEDSVLIEVFTPSRPEYAEF